MKIVNRSNIFILLHFFGWLILALGVLYNHPSDWGDHVPREFWIRQNLLLAILIVIFYVNYYLLIPRLLIKRTIYYYVPVVIAMVIATTFFINKIITLFGLDQMKFPNAQTVHPNHHGPWNNFVPGIILLIIGLGITISFIQQWQQEVILRQQLEQEKITTELTLLKAQINPHFFFNTLNTIYSYTLSNGDVARTAITNLSKMMRYVLYDAAGRQTPLRKEIDFIQEYVELMKLRITAKTTVSLEVKDLPSDVMIAPMLFLPFVENAFKHGVSGIEEGHISISILQKQDNVQLLVRNTIYDNRRIHEEQNNGIGITNTKRRLDLLYPGKYTLEAGIATNAEYEAKLQLNL